MEYRTNLKFKFIFWCEAGVMKSTYSLNNFRYGLTAEVDFRNAPTFFVNYDLNPLFRAGQGPQVRGLSFGVRL